MNERPQVVFFGSGPVAAASLEQLLGWCDVEAVITKPQPPHHREAFPAIAVAKQHGLRTLFASNRHELDQLVADSSFVSRAAVLIDYGIIVSQAVIDKFPLGIINSHFSLLPEWRGADPLTFSVLSGQAESGISLMLLVQAMDEGPLLAQAAYDMPADITTPQLTDDLIDLSDKALQHVLPAYLDGSIQPVPQEEAAMSGHANVSYSRKLNKSDSILDFTLPAVQLERQVRAFAGWPGSRTRLAGKDAIITAAHTTSNGANRPVGIAYATDDKLIAIPTPDGTFIIDRLKPAGKSEMAAQAFLAGNSLAS